MQNLIHLVAIASVPVKEFHVLQPTTIYGNIKCFVTVLTVTGIPTTIWPHPNYPMTHHSVELIL